VGDFPGAQQDSDEQYWCRKYILINLMIENITMTNLDIIQNMIFWRLDCFHIQVEPTDPSMEKQPSLQTKQTPWPSVRERTIPTERPPLVDEI
jgi:hypothetical protein